MQTRLTRLLGLDHPLLQAGMSWASSSAALPAAVSAAGALGVIAAGPMYPEALRAAIRELRQRTTAAGRSNAPFAVNVPLYNKRAAELLDVVEAEQVPVLIASQGGTKGHLARFQSQGVKWLHVVASALHARKAEDAGVDAVIAIGGEAGGHPAPDEVSAMVVVRAVLRAVRLPVIAGGGVADGAGIAAMLALGADAVQLGTRFLLTPEASVHAAYKQALLAAGIADTTLVGRGKLPVRCVRNQFTAAVDAAEQRGEDTETLAALWASRSLKEAALEGNADWGKLEAGQSVGLIDSLVPAGALVQQLMAECETARQRLAAL